MLLNCNSFSHKHIFSFNFLHKPRKNPPLSGRGRGLRERQLLHAGAKAGLLVAGEEDAVHFTGAFGQVEPGGHFCLQLADDDLRLDPQDRVDDAGHAGVGEVAGALGQDCRVCGGHVGVGAEQGGDSPVGVKAQGPLLPGGLGVEVHDLHSWQVRIGEELVQGLEGAAQAF